MVGNSLAQLKRRAHRAFVSATAFECVARRLEKELLTFLPSGGKRLDKDYLDVVCVTVPLAVNKAFGIELYIKVLLMLTTAAPAPYGHDLAKLWEKVPTSAKDRVERQYASLFPAAPLLDVEGVLAHQAKAFERFRYLHEADNAICQMSTLPVDLAIRRIILEEEPGWSADVRDLPT